MDHSNQAKFVVVNSRGSSNRASNDSLSFTRVSRSGFAGGNSIARVVHAVISRLHWLPKMVDCGLHEMDGVYKKVNIE